MIIMFIGDRVFAEIEMEKRLRIKDKSICEENEKTTEHWRSMIEEENKRLNSSMSSLTEKCSHWSEEINAFSKKYSTLDRISKDIEQLSDKEMKSKVFLGQAKEFIEKQKAEYPNLQQHILSFQDDLNLLKTNCIGKESIKSMIAEETNEDTLKENKLIKKLTHEIDICKSDLKHHQNKQLEVFENMKHNLLS